MTGRRLILLGSTGSVGTSTLDVVRHLNADGVTRIEVIGLAAGRNATRLAEQATACGVDHLALADPTDAAELAGVGTVLIGPDAARDLVEAIARPGDLVVGAMMGAAGVPATLAAIDRGCHVALANKETLVAAGAIVVPRAREQGVDLRPVDSEHAAIAQCLRAGRSLEEVRRVVITASGGPFRTWSAEQIATATVADALAHPTWSMGRKITIDSATMMNKTLEIIEAHWLFGLDAMQIDVIVHPQSLVHSFVEFIDGSVIAQLSPPDMRLPIQAALTGQERTPGCAETVDWSTLGTLDFEPPDPDRFPALRLAARVIEQGGTSGAVLNAANETAVEAFLDERIGFGEIVPLVVDALDSIEVTPVQTVKDVLDADARARQFVHGRIDAAGTRVASGR